MSALNDISSYDCLLAAWKALWGNTRAKSRDTYGVDGESLNDFAHNYIANLQTISHKLRHGRYRFSGLRPHFITKASGKVRVICIPTTQDRIVQGALLKFLSNKYSARFSNEISYGFIKGRDVKKAIEVASRKRVAKPWVFKTDIKSFFDNIKRDDLKNKLKQVVRESSLHSLLLQIVDSEIYTTNRAEKAKVAKQEIKVGYGVRQGMPLSPFFSNVVLERFDKAVTKKGYSAVRYADDLIFFGDSRASCEEIESFSAKQLALEGLMIPSSTEPNSKSVIYEPNEDAEFLGLALSPVGGKYQVKITAAQIHKIQGTFLALANVRELLARNVTLAKLGGLLKARKAGYIHAYDLSANIKELEQKLDAVEQRILKKLYQEDLLIDLKEISPAARTFLGLS